MCAPVTDAFLQNYDGKSGKFSGARAGRTIIMAWANGSNNLALGEGRFLVFVAPRQWSNFRGHAMAPCAHIGEIPHAKCASDLVYYCGAMTFIDTRRLAKRTQRNAAEIDFRRRNSEE